MIEKFQATLLGYAIGDAFGTPIEDVFRDPGEGIEPIRFYVKAFPSHPVSHLRPGQYSDETQQMLILAKSLIDAKGFSVDDIAGKFVDWFQSQKKRSEWRFPGNTLMKSCRKLAAGAPWNQSGHLSAGICASCRTVPYAMAFCRSEVLLRNAIDKSTKVTHTDKKVVGIALAFCSILQMGFERTEFDVDTIISKAIEKAAPYIPDFPKKMKQLKELLTADPVMAIKTLGNSGYSVEAFSVALYWFLKFNDNFEEMLIGAVNSGGDTDAVGAMAGAMFGAWNGLNKIPEKWITSLENAQMFKQLGCDIYRQFSSSQ